MYILCKPILLITSLLFLNSCIQSGNLLPSVAGVKDTNDQEKEPPKASEFCNNQKATNYNPGQPKSGEAENCLFILCTNPAKMGFNEVTFAEFSDYIVNKGGLLKNDEAICGDDIFKIPDDEVAFPSGYEAFHTYKEFVTEINSIVASSNGLATLVKIGNSSEGLSIMGVKVSANSKNADTLPTLLIVGTHHAREHLSTETPLLILKDFVSKAKADPNLKQELKNKTVYFIPMLNPDGAIYDVNGGSFKFWRKNTRVAVPSSGQRGVDLNRNYDSEFGGPGASSSPSSEVYHGPSAFSETESSALRDFISQKSKINFILSFHSFSELILYPWGGKDEPVPSADLKVFKKIAEKIASFTGYEPMQASDLYVATGDLCDWAFEKKNVLCITIELSPKGSAGQNGFYPSGSIIQTVVNKNIPVVNYLFGIIENPRSVAP
jgi:carboxypeptidase T